MSRIHFFFKSRYSQLGKNFEFLLRTDKVLSSLYVSNFGVIFVVKKNYLYKYNNRSEQKHYIYVVYIVLFRPETLDLGLYFTL